MSTTVTDDQRRVFFQISEAIAPTWEKRRPFIERTVTPVREWLIRELAPRAGDTVLELAAGAGDTGFEAARLAGDRGRLLSTDLSPAMLEVARRRGAELGVRNVDFRLIDAEAIALEADSVDGVICRFGYMLMVDCARALRETRRVLRPGGRVVLAVWGAPDRNPFFTAIGAALVRAGHLPPPDPDGPGPFSMGDPQRISALLAGAGFRSVRTEAVPVAFVVRDVAEYLDIVADTAGPIGLALQAVPGDERAALGATLEQALAPFATAGGFEVPGVALCAVAG
ncbi:MAG TPA: class I SAM-dependent methyltransferase [Solirubrobacteraceae bacterium]|nr:class I SAM-dependent methyltransferase [Solirubrobacteraceae bacterium]